MMQFTSTFRNLLLALVIIGTPLASFAQVAVAAGVSITVAPPPRPVYDQPACPADGDIWIPGYWAYGDDGYYWVPGYWIDPPEIGFLWTPGYWAYADGFYVWHAGYWGPQVGFYGGINYGFGYGGIGYYGGRWEGRTFYYNTAVTNVNRTIVRNTYVDRTNRAITHSRVSFNGPGGINARPTAQQRLATRERHIPATAKQMVHQQNAAKGRNQVASVNRSHSTRTTVADTGHHPAVNPSQSSANRITNTSTRTGTSALFQLIPKRF
jgi:WXXGXW repeat (2 copies)